MPTREPDPFTPASPPQASTSVQVPVDPPGPNRAVSLIVNPEAPPSQVNSFNPTNAPPHGVKWGAPRPSSTVPCRQPGMLESNSSAPGATSVCATSNTEKRVGAALAGRAVV